MRGGSGEVVPVTKVWISDIPISVDGKDIETALVRLGCVLRSSLINEKIRNKDGKLTRFLTGRRFVFVNIPQRPMERTVKIGGFTARLYYKERPRADPQRQRAPGAWREDIASLCVQTTSDAESAVRRVTSLVIQSVMPSPCGGHKAVWDNEDTPRSPMPRNPRPPGHQHQGTPDPRRPVRNAREPPSQHETSDNEASSGDEDQWEDPLPAIDDTPSEQTSQKASARQLSVTKKTKVSGKKQARDSKKKRRKKRNL